MGARDFVSVPVSLAGVRQAAAALEAWGDRHGLSAGARRRVLIAVDEVLSNVVRHGRPAQTSSAIDLTLSRLDDGAVVVEVADEGAPFNPLLAPLPDTNLPLESRRPGGLGIALVRGLADDVQYQRQGPRNRVTMTWRRACEGAGG